MRIRTEYDILMIGRFARDRARGGLWVGGRRDDAQAGEAGAVAGAPAQVEALLETWKRHTRAGP